MFDDVPARPRDGQLAPFDVVHDYDAVRRRQAARSTGSAPFLASRASSSPRARPTTPPTRRPCTGSGAGRTTSSCGRSRDDGVEPYEGSVRFARAAHEAGLAMAVVSSSANAQDVLAAAGLADLFDAARRRPRRRGAGPEGQAGARTRSSRARGAWASSRRRRPSSRMRWPGSRPAAPGASAGSSASTGSARPTRWRPTAPTSSSTTSPSSAGRPRVIGEDVFEVDPWNVRERELHLDCLGQTESVFALSNGHIGLRGNLDEGEPHGLPGTYLNGFYETRPLPYAEARLRLPRGRPDARQRHRTARSCACSSTTSPSTSATASSSTTSGSSTCATGLLRREVVWRSPAGAAVRMRSTRLVSFSHRAIAAICYEVEPLDGAHAHRRPVRAGGQRAGARRRPTTRGPRPRWRSRSSPSTTAGTSSAPRSCTARARSGLRMAAAMDHVVDGPDGTPSPRWRASPTSRASPSRTELAPGETAAGREVRRLRLVEPALRARRCATRSTRRSRRPSTPAGTACCDAQRAYLDDFWEHADVELEGDAALQQAVRFALFHVAAVRRPRRAAGHPGQGPDRAAATTATRSGTWRPSCCPSLTYIAPDAAADALRWRHSTLDLARERAPGARPRRRGVPVADDPRAGVLGLLAGGHGGVPRQRRHRRRGPRATWRRPATRTSSAGRARAARRDRAAVAVARPPRRRGRVPHRRRHRARRVQRARRQQRLHEPHGGPEPARTPRTPSGATRSARATLGRRRGGDRGLARRRRRDGRALRRASSASTRRPRSSRAYAPWDFDRTRARPVPAAAALPVLRALPRAGGQAGRPRAGAVPLRRPLHPRGEGARLRLLRGASPCATRRCRRAPGDRGGRGRPPRPGLRLLRRDRVHRPARPRRATRDDGLHIASLAGRLARRRRRLRRHARPRRPARVRAAAARAR